MYAIINTVAKEKVNIGDPVVIKFDCQTGRIAAFDIDGTVYGFLSDNQPLGCVDANKMYRTIGNYRYIARAASVTDGCMILSLDTPAQFTAEYRRIEKQGYGILVPVA